MTIGVQVPGWVGRVLVWANVPFVEVDEALECRRCGRIVDVGGEDAHELLFHPGRQLDKWDLP